MTEVQENKHVSSPNLGHFGKYPIEQDNWSSWMISKPRDREGKPTFSESNCEVTYSEGRRIGVTDSIYNGCIFNINQTTFLFFSNLNRSHIYFIKSDVYWEQTKVKKTAVECFYLFVLYGISLLMYVYHIQIHIY